jgi:hypothetical protein
MPTPHQKWTVLPHGKLTEIDPNLLTVTGSLHMPFTELPRRMTIARLADRRLVVFSAVALDEKSMRTVEDYGRPAYLVVPSDKHRMDAKIWQDRYPAMQVIAPEGARRKVEEMLRVGTTQPNFADPSVEFQTVPGTGRHEAALVVHTVNGTTLVLNDLVGNIRESSGLGGWFLRKTNFAGDGPQLPWPVKFALVDDKEALRLQFLEWAALPGLRRVLVSHGDPIDFQPAEALRDLAHTLARARPERLPAAPA